MQFGDLQLIPFRDLLIHFRDLKLIHFRGLKLIHFGNWKFIRYVKSLLKILDLYNCDSSYFTRILINVATNFVDLIFFYWNKNVS